MDKEVSKNKLNVWLPLLLSVMMLGGMVVGTKLKPSSQKTTIVFENTEGSSQAVGQGRVEELIRYIQAKYVDTVNTDQLVEKAITSLFQDLDPHSVYMSTEQVKKANEQLDGSFVGIGIEYILLGDTIAILNLMEGGPAEKAGLKKGDRIIDAFNLDTTNDSISEIRDTSLIKRLRGANKSKVEVSILRPGESGILKKEITRSKIIVSSVDVHYMLNENTGYIKLNKFSANTITDFMDALSVLVDEHKMTNLIFDLRQNGGGYLHEAIKILNQIFSEKDRKLVYTIGKNVKKEEFFSTGRNVFDIDKVCVLIDENSASASEIVAGAIQDWDRGLIIGRRSYGKGLVQEQYDLKDGSALRLTVARYFTPAGRLIQRDYDEKEKYDGYIQRRINSGEFTNMDQVQISDTSKFYTANGRQVFAGGGITPDVYVPYDSLLLDRYYLDLNSSITKFAFNFVEANTIDMNEQTFIDNYQIDNEVIEDLIKFHHSITSSVKPENPINSKINFELRNSIKARIGKQLFGDEAFYRILNSDDPVLIEALNAQKTYNQLTHNQ